MDKKLLKYYQKYGAIYVAEYDKKSLSYFNKRVILGLVLMPFVSCFLFYIAYQDISSYYPQWCIMLIALLLLILYPFILFAQNKIKIIVTPDSVLLINPFNKTSFLIKNLNEIRGKKMLMFICNDGIVYQNNSYINYDIEKLLDCLIQINPDIRYFEKGIDTDYLDVK